MRDAVSTDNLTANKLSWPNPSIIVQIGHDVGGNFNIHIWDTSKITKKAGSLSPYCFM